VRFSIEDYNYDNMIKIECPVTQSREVKILARMGADIFYCGLIPDGWLDKYGTAAAPNRKEELVSQVKGKEDFKKILALSHKENIPVYNTLNSPMYTLDQYDLVLPFVDELVSMGVDGFIIADPFLLKFLSLKYKSIRWMISTMGGVLNAEACHFYKELGATGITLPTSVTLEEIKDLSSRFSRSLDLVAFVLNENPVGINAYCAFAHGFDDSITPCRRLYHSRPLGCKSCSQVVDVPSSQVVERPAVYIEPSTGLDSLWDFQECGICAVKFSGRFFPLEEKMQYMQYISKARSLLEESASRDEFIKKYGLLFHHIHKRPMAIEDSYYPVRS